MFTSHPTLVLALAAKATVWADMAGEVSQMSDDAYRLYRSCERIGAVGKGWCIAGEAFFNAVPAV